MNSQSVHADSAKLMAEGLRDRDHAIHVAQRPPLKEFVESVPEVAAGESVYGTHDREPGIPYGRGVEYVGACAMHMRHDRS
jgi:hypothetical protein